MDQFESDSNPTRPTCSTALCCTSHGRILHKHQVTILMDIMCCLLLHDQNLNHICETLIFHHDGRSGDGQRDKGGGTATHKGTDGRRNWHCARRRSTMASSNYWAILPRPVSYSLISFVQLSDSNPSSRNLPVNRESSSSYQKQNDKKPTRILTSIRP